MAERRSTLWSRGTLISHRPRLGRPVLFGIGLVLLVCALDGALSLGLWLGGPPRDLAYQSAGAVRATLDRASRGPGESWLLLGDSVLVGDSVQEEVPDWHRHRIVDYLNAEVRRDRDIHFHQVALNGMLLTDILRVLRELDRFDPAGKTGVLLELNLRMFSAHYAEEDGVTRAWLEGLGRPVAQGGDLDSLALLRVAGLGLGDWIRRHAPLFRHRDLLPNPLAPNTLLPYLRGDEATGGDPLEVMARVHEHFRAPLLVGDFAQLRALDEILARLKAAERPALLFTPPLSSRYFQEVSDPLRYGEDLAWLSRRVDAVAGETITLRHFDHPLFDARYFKDLAHMFPEGNRLLALNILHALKAPFAQAPKAEDLVAYEDTSETLVWQVNPGMNEGPAWLAAFRHPEAVAVDRNGRVVVADTGNHVLRELDRSRSTVRILAGQSEKPGHEDGPPLDALLQSPRHLCFGEGDEVFFVDGAKGERLRRLTGGLVLTEAPLEGESWGRISGLAYRNGLVYLLDERERILAYDPRSGLCRMVCTGAPLEGIRAFDVSVDGRLFVVDGRNRIWVSSVHPEIPLLFTFQPLFENVGGALFPEGLYYPYPKEEQKLEAVQSIRYVAPYNGLLIQDGITPQQAVTDFDENIQLHFLCLDTETIMPWVQATAQGGYLHWNARAETYVSAFRAGSFAMGPDTARLYYLERNRSRLFSIGDGLWEASKIGQVAPMKHKFAHPDRFGNRSGEALLFMKSPDQFQRHHAQEDEMAGPYLGLIVGPSIVAASEMMPHYSLARVIEGHLARRLALEHRIRFEAFVRTEGGLGFDASIEEFLRFLDLGGRVDMAFIAVTNMAGLREGADPLYYLQELAAAAEQYDTRVVFFDGHVLFGRYRDALQPLPESFQESKARIRAAGFEVVDIGPSFLRETQRMHPIGSPPFEEHHAAPWAIEKAGELLAARLYPMAVEHLAGRWPALKRAAPERSEEEEFLLLTAYEEGLARMGPFEPVAMPPDALQRRYHGRYLDLLLDLKKLPAYRSPTTGASLEHIALSVLHHTLRHDVAGRRALGARLRLAVFSNYDEYGAGVAASADVLWSKDIEPGQVAAWMASIAAAPSTESSRQTQEPEEAL